MIDYLKNMSEQPRQGLYNKLAPTDAPLQLDTLTLEKNSVLVVRIPKNDFYNFEVIQDLYKALKDRFPMHQVFVWYNDVEFMVINDHGYPPERITCNDETSNYY